MTIDTDKTQFKSAKNAWQSVILFIVTSISKRICFFFKGVSGTHVYEPEKIWDILSINFDKGVEKFEQTYIKIIDKSRKHLNVNNIVLDYGCATGTIAIEISKNVKKVYGIDISCRMIELAKRKAIERKIENVDFSQVTIFDKKFKKGSFDVILAFNVLHYLADNQNVLKRINELLKPEGFFISATECMGEKKTFLNIVLFLLTKIGIVAYVRFFKVSELKDSITAGNFQIIESERLSGSEEPLFIVARKI
jgi:2-polyprenyl-3-methyl-5-hydroxy-6-metoxy-1,4-benzoquinol methylase